MLPAPGRNDPLLFSLNLVEEESGYCENCLMKRPRIRGHRLLKYNHILSIFELSEQTQRGSNKGHWFSIFFVFVDAPYNRRQYKNIRTIRHESPETMFLGQLKVG